MLIKVFFVCLIISYLRIKSYNVLNYNNCSTDWPFPLKEKNVYCVTFQNSLPWSEQYQNIWKSGEATTFIALLLFKIKQIIFTIFIHEDFHKDGSKVVKQKIIFLKYHITTYMDGN